MGLFPRRIDMDCVSFYIRELPSERRIVYGGSPLSDDPVIVLRTICSCSRFFDTRMSFFQTALHRRNESSKCRERDQQVLGCSNRMAFQPRHLVEWASHKTRIENLH